MCCPNLIDLSCMLFKVDRLEERRNNALFLKRKAWTGARTTLTPDRRKVVEWD